MEGFNLDDLDVVFFEEGWGPNNFQTYRADIFLRLMEKWSRDNLNNVKFILPFLLEGIECQLLRTNSQWVNGTVRFRLEFIPNGPGGEEPLLLSAGTLVETESPLDDLRVKLNLNNE